MKKVFTNFFCLLIAMSIAFSACEGPEGDVGPQGAQGDKKETKVIQAMMAQTILARCSYKIILSRQRY